MERLNLPLCVIVVLCCNIYLTATQPSECKLSISTVDFHSYVSNYESCRVRRDLTQFQNEFPIAGQAFKLDGTFVKDAINYTKLSEFCMDVARCKGQVSTCESDLNDFIQSSGMALCQNGEAMTKEIMDAADTLTTDPCSGDFDPVGTLPDGCYLVPDTATLPTYLTFINRRNRIKSAENRCLSRYLESQEVCTHAGLKAMATILAASDRVERIGRSYDAYTQFGSRALSKDRTKLSLHGFVHLYQNEKKQSTCEKLAGSNILLWNTYIKIDGTTSRLAPTVDTMILSNILIQFSNDAGQVIDSYMATTSDPVLAKQTLRQLGEVETSITVDIINEELIVLYHPVTKMKIAIGSVGQALSIVINMPTSLYKLESVGLLVDGCEAYGGSTVTELAAGSNAECISNCSASKVPTTFQDECAYDCTNGVDRPEDIYSSIETQNEEVDKPVVEDGSGATVLAVSISTMLLSLTLTSLL